MLAQVEPVELAAEKKVEEACNCKNNAKRSISGIGTSLPVHGAEKELRLNPPKVDECQGENLREENQHVPIFSPLLATNISVQSSSSKASKENSRCKDKYIPNCPSRTTHFFQDRSNCEHLVRAFSLPRFREFIKRENPADAQQYGTNQSSGFREAGKSLMISERKIGFLYRLAAMQKLGFLYCSPASQKLGFLYCSPASQKLGFFYRPPLGFLYACLQDWSL
ncbi:hypothetical protein ACH5RR_023253 [Cinchona calisaya]|uniref:Uncharacterized protein n=1 Tax=Cinchona calisaya TaxID=153742 RepID=A0ABD2ZA46_9GENT